MILWDLLFLLEAKCKTSLKADFLPILGREEMASTASSRILDENFMATKVLILFP